MNGRVSKLLRHAMLPGQSRRAAKRTIKGMNRAERTALYAVLKEKVQQVRELEE
jgi:hypothetical protein